MILRCEACGAAHPATMAAIACPACEGLLAVETAGGPDAAAQRARYDRPSASIMPADQSGVWRYADALAPNVAAADIVSLAEGNTPVFTSDRLRDWVGSSALFAVKHEGMNPTGSFKDRGMTVAMTQARRIGATAVACASTGNTSASAAAYAAVAGLPCYVFVPAGAVASGKLAQTRAYGATIVAVRGDFDDALRLLRIASARLGVYLVNSVNPFRIAGQQSIVYETLHRAGWKVPQYIALPAGNLGNLSAFGAALRRLAADGMIASVPRLVAVQAAGAAPFARAFHEGFTERHTVRAETIATAIRIGAPASWERAVRAIRETDGIVVSVSDDEIMAAKREVDACGIGCEPASAASVAGVRRLIASGDLSADRWGVAVLTGHVLKDPEANAQGSRLDVAIEATVEAVERVFSRS